MSDVAPSVVLDSVALARRYDWTPQYVRLLRMRRQGPAFFKPTGRRNSKVFYKLEDVLAWEAANRFSSTAAFPESMKSNVVTGSVAP